MPQIPLYKEVLELYLCLLRLNKTLGTQLEPEQTAPALSPSQINALIALSQRAPQSMGELAEQLLVQRQQITQIVDILVRRGLVARRHSRTNRRMVLAELTEEGRKTVEHLGSTFRQVLPQDLDHVHRLQQALETVNNLMTKTA